VSIISFREGKRKKSAVELSRGGTGAAIRNRRSAGERQGRLCLNRGRGHGGKTGVYMICHGVKFWGERQKDCAGGEEEQIILLLKRKEKGWFGKKESDERVREFGKWGRS